MTDIGYVTLYVNAIAIMLSIGIMAMVWKLKMKDALEKKIFIGLLILVILMGAFYILCALRDDKMISCSHLGAMLLETGLELLINAYAFQWFIYVEYRLYHSVDHIRRNVLLFSGPFLVITIMDLVNIFTEFLLQYDDELGIITETPVYVLTDVIRLGYFICTLFILELRKRHDDSLKFFSVRPFFIPVMIYVLLYYFTPYATVDLGLAIGLTLIYVELINEKCYQDSESGFFNRLYLDYLRGRITEGKYDLESALVYELPGADMATSAKLILKQLPKDCDTIRYGKDIVVTLTKVNNRGPLSMLSEDVQQSLDEAGIPVEVRIDLKKKKESGAEFLERVLAKG